MQRTFLACLLGVCLFGFSQNALGDVSVNIKNNKSQVIEVKLIAKTQNANARFVVQKNADRTVIIDPPAMSDQIIVAWGNGKILGSATVSSTTINDPKLKKLLVIVDNTGVRIDFQFK